jgi:hypothetical protein
MKNYFKKCLAIQNKEFAIASTFLRGKFSPQSTFRITGTNYLFNT